MRTQAVLFAMVALAGAAWGQPGMPGPLPVASRLVLYLELKPDQIVDLGKIQAEWQRYLASKVRRVQQVEREIRDATLAEVVDPSALGVRYMELEAICREARDTEARIRESARKILTDAQRAKLAVLEEAYRLLPEIAEADALHLIYAPLPGLDLGGLGPRAPRPYPGCRFPERPGPGPLLTAAPEN